MKYRKITYLETKKISCKITKKKKPAKLRQKKKIVKLHNYKIEKKFAKSLIIFKK